MIAMNASDDLADLFCHSSVDGHISMDEDEDDFDVAAIGRVDDAASFQAPTETESTELPSLDVSGIAPEQGTRFFRPRCHLLPA